MDMTADEMYEAYGPDGPDAADIAAWKEACIRTCEHDAALDAMDALNRDGLCCPDCGREVTRAALDVRDPIDAAEQRYWRQISC